MLAFVRDTFFYVVPFLLVLTTVITVHELGHFTCARAFGIAVDRFSIGFGRTGAAWRDRAGVEWRIGLLPLGGYVRFAGDENAAGVPDREDLADLRQRVLAKEGPGADRRYLQFRPVWQRALVVLAGPAANFVLAIVLFAAIFATLGQAETPFSVGAVQPGSAAERAGFLPGDRILAADGHAIGGFDDLASYVAYRDGTPIRFVIERQGEERRIVATPGRRQLETAFGGSQTAGLLGISPHPEGVWRLRRLGPAQALAAGAQETWSVLSTTVFYLGRMIGGQVSPDQLHSVLGMARASGTITRQAVGQSPHDLAMQWAAAAAGLTGFAALISVSIGFMNLLPLPVLDGGHLVFYAYEWVMGRPMPTQAQAAGYRIGLALLVGLMLFATWNDVQRLPLFHLLGSLFS